MRASVFVNKSAQASSDKIPAQIREDREVIKAFEVVGSETEDEKPFIADPEAEICPVTEDYHSGPDKQDEPIRQFSEERVYQHGQSQSMKDAPLDQDGRIFIPGLVKQN